MRQMRSQDQKMNRIVRTLGSEGCGKKYLNSLSVISFGCCRIDRKSFKSTTCKIRDMSLPIYIRNI